MKKRSLLISACLLGLNCKYDGGNNALSEDLLCRLRERYELVPVCPEAAGGLPIPREPCERKGFRVLTKSGGDVTAAFRAGASLALDRARARGCTLALLKERSPSCGPGSIYDGSFSGKLIPGDGVTAQLLRAEGLKLCGETRAEELCS